MAITSIFNKFIKRESEQDTNFLALTLTPDRVLATIWALDGEKVEVLGFSRKSFQNLDSIVHQSAVAIDTAAEKAQSDVSQVVFGLSNSWFAEGKIKKETTRLLRKLSQELELDAQAFIPISSSIKNYFKVRDGITASTILIGMYSNSLEVHLLRNNEVEKSLDSKSKPTLEKIIELVKQLGEKDNLPSKITVFGIPEDSKLAEEILKSDFKNAFINNPKVEFLKNREVSKSVAYSQATDVLGHELSLAPVTSAISQLPKDEIENAAAEAGVMGFVEGEDVLKKQIVDEAEDSIDSQQKEDLAVEVDENIQRQERSDLEEKHQGKQKASLIENIATLSWVSKFSNIFKGPGIRKKLSIGLAVIIVFGIVGGYVAGKTLSTAEVVIKVNAQSQEEDFDVDVVTGAVTNFSRGQIAGQIISGQASGSRKAVVTGVKEVGEPAKGEVTVLNWTTAEKSFENGTVIISSGGIKFELDGGVSIASRSASTPGQSNVGVSAIDLGSEGNLGAGTEFSFQEFDELLYSATNDNAFSGGDEREVTVVSQEDLDNLKDSLFESLEQNAIQDLRDKLAGKTFSEDSIEVEITNNSFDASLDEEASLVNLDMTIEATAVAYSEDDLKKLLSENVNEDAPENLEAKAEDIRIINLDATPTSRGANITGTFEARFVPKFEEEALKEGISGKSVKEARELIKNIPEVSDVNVNFSPSFLFINTLPSKKEKITFKVET